MSVIIERWPFPKGGSAEALIEEARERQRRRRRRISFLLAFAAVGIIVGFFISRSTGESNAAPLSTSAAGLPKPCSLLTKAQAEQVLGGRVTSRAGSGDSCTWTGAAVGYSATQQHLIVQLSRESFTRFQQTFAKLANQRPPLAVFVHGVGQAAFSVNRGQTLVVWQEGTALSISATSLSAYPQWGKSLARAALRHL